MNFCIDTHILHQEFRFFVFDRDIETNVSHLYSTQMTSGSLDEIVTWAPPTPPHDDVYVDPSLGFLYERSIMSESELPPVYVPREPCKRMRLDASGHMVPLIGQPSRVKPRPKKDDIIQIPRSLFDRPSAALLRLRRELKALRLKGQLVGGPDAPLLHKMLSMFAPNQSIPTPMTLWAQAQAAKTSNLLLAALNSDAHSPWGIMEEWFVMQVVQQLQEIPSSLVIVSPGHTPNWDFASEVVSTGTHTYRSSRIVRHHYESVILPREEGKTLPVSNENVQAKKSKKKQQGLPGVVPPPTTPPKMKIPRTKHLFNRDDYKTFTQTCNLRIETMKEMSRKRPEAPHHTFTAGAVKPKHVAILQELGIGYETPMLPTQVASNRQERIAKEKAKQQADNLVRQKQALISAKQLQFQKQLQQQNQQQVQVQQPNQQQPHVVPAQVVQGPAVSVLPGVNVSQMTSMAQPRIPAPGYPTGTQIVQQPIQQQSLQSPVRATHVPSISVTTPATSSVQSSIPEVEQLARALSQAAASFESQNQQQQAAAAAQQQQQHMQQQPGLVQSVPQQRPQQVQAQLVSSGQVFNIAVQGQPMQVQQRFVGPAVSASVRPLPANHAQQQLQNQQFKRQVHQRQQMAQQSQVGQTQQIQLQQQQVGQTLQQTQSFPQIGQLTGQRLQFPGTISQQINVQQVSGSPMTVTTTVPSSASAVSVSPVVASSPVLTKTLVSGPPVQTMQTQQPQQPQQQPQQQLATRTMTVTGTPTSVSTLQVTPGQRILTQARPGQAGLVTRNATDIEAILRQQGMQLRPAIQTQQQQNKPQILQIQLVPFQGQQSQGQPQQTTQILGIQPSQGQQPQQVTKTMTVTGTPTSTIHVTPATSRIVGRTPGQVVTRTVTEAEYQALTGQRQIQFQSNITGQINVQSVPGTTATSATSGSTVAPASVSASPVLSQTLVSGSAATMQQQAVQQQHSTQLLTRTMTVTSGTGTSGGQTISAIQVTPAGISQGQKAFVATTTARGQPQAVVRSMTEADLQLLIRQNRIQIPSQSQQQQMQGSNKPHVIQIQSLPPQQQQFLANLAQQQQMLQQHQHQGQQSQQQSMSQQQQPHQQTIQLQSTQIPANIAIVKVSSSSATTSATSQTTTQTSQPQNQPPTPDNSSSQQN